MEKIEEEIKDMTPKLIGKTWKKPPTLTNKQAVLFGLYECQYCGNKYEVRVNNVKRGRSKSCGCMQRSGSHKLTTHRFYKTWMGMIHRCTNAKNPAYKHYGERGITICEEWLDVATFINWCEDTYIEGMTLDRIDNDKGYSPDNCRWEGKATQKINQRMMKNNKSGFVGIFWDCKNKNWRASVRFNYNLINLGSFKDKMEAVQARDNYITEHKLPHKLSTQY